MNTDLFPEVVAKSPRLQWYDDHGIGVAENPNFVEPGQECDLTGKQVFKFCVHGFKEPGDTRPSRAIGEADTEEDVVADWARKAGVRLWNEVGYVAPRRKHVQR